MTQFKSKSLMRVRAGNFLVDFDINGNFETNVKELIDILKEVRGVEMIGEENTEVKETKIEEVVEEVKTEEVKTEKKSKKKSKKRK